MQEWAYVNKKPTQAVEKIKYSTIFNCVNAPLMARFGGIKETTVKFIISRYHNGQFYFDRLVDISREVIPQLTGLSNEGNPVPVGIKEGLVEELTGSLSGKNSKGLMISHITTQTPQTVAKIIGITLTLVG